MKKSVTTLLIISLASIILISSCALDIDTRSPYGSCKYKSTHNKRRHCRKRHRENRRKNKEWNKIKYKEKRMRNY